MIPVKIHGALIEPGNNTGGQLISHTQAEGGGGEWTQLFIAAHESLIIIIRKQVAVKIGSSLFVSAGFKFEQPVVVGMRITQLTVARVNTPAVREFTAVGADGGAGREVMQCAYTHCLA